jgi:hypothetical protein
LKRSPQACLAVAKVPFARGSAGLFVLSMFLDTRWFEERKVSRQKLFGESEPVGDAGCRSGGHRPLNIGMPSPSHKRPARPCGPLPVTILPFSLASQPCDLDAAKEYQAAKQNGIATVHAGCNREPNVAKLTKHCQGW